MHYHLLERQVGLKLGSKSKRNEMGPPIESQKGLKECVLILSIVKLSLMSIIEKVFKYGETECKDDIWFRGKTLAEALGYSNPLKAIHMHIDSEDKKEMSELVYKGGAQNGHPFRNVQQRIIYVNESGLYSLVLRSQLESTCAFK